MKNTIISIVKKCKKILSIKKSIKNKMDILDGRLPIRFNTLNSEKLSRHFKKKGLSLSSGIRMVLAEYMERENIF